MSVVLAASRPRRKASGGRTGRERRQGTQAGTDAPPKTLAELLDACIGPAFAAQGFASSDILAAWPDIVGERLAGACQPMKLEWPRRWSTDREAPPEPGTLVVRVESAMALELQHLAPVVVQRINAHYGWRCVGRLALRQGPVAGPRSRVRAAPPLDPERRARVAGAVSTIAEDPLRQALDRLGTAVEGAQPHPSPRAERDRGAPLASS